MKHIIPYSLFLIPFVANAGVIGEVREGLDVYVGRTTAYVADDRSVGELGGEVYPSLHSHDTRDIIYVPDDMYIRAGVGSDIEFDDRIVAQIGFGWNASSYVRLELDGQYHSFYDADVNSWQGGGTLYFDLARRYVRTGDIIRRRSFVPFIGIGAGIGAYDSEFFAAPRGVAGVNFMFTDTFGVDLSYQYSIMLGDGWDKNMSDVMLSARFNF